MPGGGEHSYRPHFLVFIRKETDCTISFHGLKKSGSDEMVLDGKHPACVFGKGRVEVRFVQRFAGRKSAVTAGNHQLRTDKGIGNSISKLLRTRLPAHDLNLRAEHDTFTVLGPDGVPDKGQGYRNRGMRMDNRQMTGFCVYFPVNPVLARCTGRNLPGQRYKERFSGNIEIRPGALDIKTIHSIPHADIPKIPSHEVLGKEPSAYPLKFTRIHVSHRFFMQNSFAYSTIYAWVFRYSWLSQGSALSSRAFNDQRGS